MAALSGGSSTRRTEAVDWGDKQLAMGTRVVATCTIRRRGGRAWRVHRDLEGAAAVRAAASRGDSAWAAVDRSAAQQGGATAGGSAAASVRSGGDDWRELNVGDGRSGATTAETAAAALRDGGDLRASPPPLFPSTEILARDFQDLSHVRMGRSHQNFLSSLLHQKRLHDTLSSLPYIGERKRRVALRAIP